MEKIQAAIANSLPLRSGSNHLLATKAVFVVLLFALVVPVVFNWLSFSSYHDGQRYLQFAVLACCVLFLMLHCSTSRVQLIGFTSKQSGVVLMAVGALVAASVFSNLRLQHALIELAIFSGMAAMGLAVKLSLGQNQGWAAVCYRLGLSVGLLYMLVIFLPLYVAMLFTPDSSIHIFSLFDQFSSVRFFNHVQTVSTVIGIGALLDQDRRWRIVAWASLLFSVTLLYLSGGRATMLALVAAFFCLAFLSPALLKAVARKIASAVVCGLLLGFVMANLPAWLGDPNRLVMESTVQRSVGMASTHARFVLWHDAWKIALEHPWLGAGPMSFAAAKSQAAHPHNFVFQLLAEYGFVFTLLLAVGTGTVLYRRVSKLRTGLLEDPALTTIGLCAVAAILVDAQFSGNFVMPMSQLWIAFAFGLAFASRSLIDQERYAKKPTIWLARSIATLIFLVFCTGLASGVWSGILTNPSPAMQTPWLTWQANWPRLWEQGLIP
jgi:putative inorganic carbon (hco3(-)) transporter